MHEIVSLRLELALHMGKDVEGAIKLVIFKLYAKQRLSRKSQHKVWMRGQ